MPLQIGRKVARLPVGRQVAFRVQEWSEIQAFLGSMAAAHPEFEHMVMIVDSVLQSDASDRLAGCTSMHDLIVVPRPVPEAPYDVIRVCSPSSIRPVAAGTVLIEHLAATGNNERIVRAVADAVPLFWRFVREKYGIEPIQPANHGLG